MASKDKIIETAQKFIDKGQIAKAIGEYQKLVDGFPKEFRYRQKIAELLSRERRNEEAQPHYEAVAKNFTETGFYLKAVAIYKQMQKVEPDRADLYLRLGELYEKHGVPGNALTEYRNLVAFYDKNKQAREAVPVLQKMVTLDPENLGIRGKLIETLCSCHDEDGAREQFHSLVVFLDGKGEHGKIVKLYDKFQELCPDAIASQLPLAKALLASDQASKALQLAKGLLKHDPEDAEVLGLLIDCHQALENHEDARLTCKHLLKNFPDNLLLRERYVRICLAAGDGSRALTSLEEARASFSQAGQNRLFEELVSEVQAGLSDHSPPKSRLKTPPETEPVVIPAESDAIPIEPSAPLGKDTPPVVLDVKPVPPVAAPSLVDLEFDLDLDLEMSDTFAPPAASLEEGPTPASAEPLVSDTALPLVKDDPVPVETSSELELELDLDLVGFVEVAKLKEEVTPAPAVPPSSVEDEMELEIEFEDVAEVATDTVPTTLRPEPLAALEDDLELELDFDVEFDVQAETETEPVGEIVHEIGSVPESVTTVEIVTEPEIEFEVEIEFEPVPEPEAEPEAEAEVASEDAAKAELTLTDSGDLDLEMEFSEQIPETDAAIAAEAEATPDIEDSPAVAEATPLEFTEESSVAEFDPVTEVDEASDVAEVVADSVGPAEVEAFAELEELDELDEIVEVVEVLDEIEELEELEDVEEVFEEVADTAQVFVAPEDEPVEDFLPGLNEAPSAVLLRAGLEEAEFYLRQGLLEDAERVASELQSSFTDAPEVAAKLLEIQLQRQTLVDADEFAANPLADINDDELLGGVEFDQPAEPVVDEFSLEPPGAEDDDDIQSHFDLGIAYKEMGLFGDAVAEFDRASRDPSRQLECLTLKGQCQIDMGDPVAAESTYRQALETPLLREEGRIVLCYELGLLYEILGRKQEALDNFRIVADIDLFFRDVTDKLKGLRLELGIDDQAIEVVSEGGSGRDRISFV